MAPRSSPQLRLFRNDFAAGNAALALRLTGTKSNRDAVGARVTVETDQGRATRIVKAGSGFISQHSKELLFGLGKSQRIVEGDDRVAERPGRRRSPTFRSTSASGSRKGSDAVRTEPFRDGSVPAPRAPHAAPRRRRRQSARSGDLALPALSRARLHASRTSTGRSIRCRRWPAGPCCSCSGRPGRRPRARRSRSCRGSAQALAGGRAPRSWPWPSTRRRTRRRSGPPRRACGLPVMIAGDEVAGTYSILHRYLFDRREDLRLPTAFLMNAAGRDRQGLRDADRRRADRRGHRRRSRRPAAERLARAVPFPGTFYSQPGRAQLLPVRAGAVRAGLRRAGARSPSSASRKVDPSAITFYNLGTLYMKRGQPAEARAAFERALQLKPDYADASNSLGALLAQSGDVPGRDRALPRGARRRSPSSPTRSTISASRSSRPASRRRPTSSTRRRWRCSPTFPRRSTTSASSSAARAISIAR